MANYESILKYYLLALSALIGTLGLLVLIGDWGINDTFDSSPKPEPKSLPKTEKKHEQLPEFSITRIELKHGCSILIQTSYDNLPQGEEVECSILGKDGTYELNKTDSVAHRLFAAKGLKTYNIWAVFRGDTISYIENGNGIEGYGCD